MQDNLSTLGQSHISCGLLDQIPTYVSSVITVDLSCIAHNYQFVKNFSAPAKCYPVMKCDAYGMGIGPVARTFWREGAQGFYVATLEEAIHLRKLLPEALIYVLNGLPFDAEPFFEEYSLIPVLGSTGQVERWHRWCKKQNTSGPCKLQIETGLNRLGLGLEEVIQLAEIPGFFKGMNLQGIMTHLACSYIPGDPYNEIQSQRFLRLRALFPNVPLSISASGGMLQDNSYLLDAVRPGRLLYGSSFSAREDVIPSVKPVVGLYARIIHLSSIESGTPIGYNRTFYADRPMKIATLGMGYGDGYFSNLSNKAYGELAGFSIPIVGRISMDLMVVDVTNVPENFVKEGAWVALLSPSLTVDTIAEWAGTASWEILSHLGKRPWRLYHEAGQVIAAGPYHSFG